MPLFAMQVIRYSDPDAFLAAVAPMRARGEASASFFIGWVHMMKRAPPEAERICLAICAGERVRGAAILRDEGPAIIGESDVDAALALADDLRATGRSCRASSAHRREARPSRAGGTS